MNKKILLIGSLLTPLITFSCTHTSPPEPSKPKPDPVPPLKKPNISDLDKGIWERASDNKILLDVDPSKEANAFEQTYDMYNAVYSKYKQFTKIDIFAPKDWIKSNGSEIKEERKQKQSIYPFNLTFFHNSFDYLRDKNVLEYLPIASAVKITNKDQFDKYIINRFKELNPHEDFNQDSQIKKLFEELYLDNQDVYQVLEENNIYIHKTGRPTHYRYDEMIIPTYDENQVTINIVYDFLLNGSSYMVVPTSAEVNTNPPTYWIVYLIKKSNNIKYHQIFREYGEKYESYKQRFEKWFKEEFEKKFS
ncbi:hypothetical protein [Mycoplasmopsis bovirhinis]|uniref:Lipoprotein n=1 Tax=Mycoplasmopsis bovirhinis TaxID=29553 RepID=A0A449ACG1_9BACT|nr:hypothetical protein [Mycoplasmopsis bovirhinis]VEU62671.1 Uncharacterised protein [Mycoplasmopsis bovirhinis]